MPFEFQRSIVIYGGEDGIVDWTDIETVDWFDKEKVQVWIDDYAKVYADREFRIGTISIEDVKDRVIQRSGFAAQFDSFDDYHERYYDGTDHGDSVFPIVVSDCEEYIEDGWHRFHSYVEKGLKKIPFVEYV